MRGFGTMSPGLCYEFSQTSCWLDLWQIYKVESKSAAGEAFSNVKVGHKAFMSLKLLLKQFLYEPSVHCYYDASVVSLACTPCNSYHQAKISPPISTIHQCEREYNPWLLAIESTGANGDRIYPFVLHLCQHALAG